MDKVCIDPWEVHCVECGEPDCYTSCPNYRRARTGRCERIVDGRFLAWGKIELLWHGRLADRWVAHVANGINRILEPLALALGARAYRVFRSMRWRSLKRIARYQGQPTVWRIACFSRADATLYASVAKPGGEEVLRREIRIKAGEETRVEMAIPTIPELSLFRVASYEGTAARIDFTQNELTRPGCARIKCVAWDLDGTIWDGTLSEGDEVRLRNRTIETIKALDDAGIVNSICSKNDEVEALAKLKSFGIEEYFVFPQINWGAKSESIKKLAQEMNLALDAIAFVDDREENRVEVETECPGVLVLDEKAGTGNFWRDIIGNERRGLGSDRRRMYRDEMRRRCDEKMFEGDGEAFLKASGIKVELEPVEGENFERCLELVNRTNQLTISGRRYSESEFRVLVERGNSCAVRVRDKYGNYGVVGFVAWSKEKIEELVFSCRVAGKGVEWTVLDRVAKGLKIDVVETERNAPIRKIIKEWLAK